MHMRLSLLALALPLLLAAGEPPSPPAPPRAAERAAAIKAAMPLVQEVEQKAKTDRDGAARDAEKALDALMPALFDPANHDPDAAALMARIALVTRGIYDLVMAQALLDECRRDRVPDSRIADLLPQVKKLADSDIYDFFAKERSELRVILLRVRTGDIDAMNDAGNAYARGDGTLTNHDEAKRYYLYAATAGNAKAMASMAIYEKTDSKIREWLEKSYKAGNMLAADDLGELYAGTRMGFLKTHDVPKDLDKAFAWFRVAFHAGYPSAADSLAKLCDDKNFSGYDPAAALGYLRIAAEQARLDSINTLKARKLALLDPGFAFQTPKARPEFGKDPSPIGALVTSIDPKGPAAARLKDNDIITGVNGAPFSSDFEFRRLMYMSTDGKLRLTVLRGEEESSVTIDASSAPVK
ncbi:MAG TPA: PDZ domain-containing protein [Phycisphaerae bacterium]|nr:PDZ domain-containing protein [Phycisphaerae bacterium]